MKSAILIIAVMSSAILAQKCDTINQHYNVYATVNETKEWDMRKYFFTGENLKFKINNDCPYFETVDPLSEIGDPVPHGDPSIGNIQNLKAYRSFDNGAWLNDFVFLEQNKTDIDVFYALGDPQKMDQVPRFHAQVNVRDSIVSFVCHDLDFLTNYLIVIDCQQPDLDDVVHLGYHNGFIVVDLQDSQHYDISPNEHPKGFNYNYTEDRKIAFHNFSFSTSEEDLEGGVGADKISLLFRAEPAWATEFADLANDKLDEDCELEVYKYSNKKFSSTPVAYLTKVELAALLGTNSTTQKFAIMDFQLEPNGDIYVLDGENGVYVLQFTSQALEWKLKEHISFPYVTKSYGFDFNYLINNDGTITRHMVLVFKDKANFYENGVMKFGIKLPENANYGRVQVQMSQYYLILKLDTVVHVYHSDDGSKLYTYTNDLFDQLIINPYEPDLLGVNKNSAHRFLISNGYLRLKKQDSTNDGTKTYTLDAISLDDVSQKCSVTVNVRVLNKNDTTIYEQSNHPFPQTLRVPTAPIGIDLIASGPNLQYSSLATLEHPELGNSKIIVTIKSAWNLQLNGIRLPDAKEVIYSDILVTDSADQFYLLVQIPTKIIYVYQCKHSLSDHENAECKDFDNFSLGVQINKNKHSFFWWIYINSITYMYQDTDYSIQIYTSTGGQVKSVGQVAVDSTDPMNKFSSVTMVKSGIYCVQEDRKTVQIYEATLPFRLIYEINSSVLAEYKIEGYFIPKRVFSNKKARAQLVFIQSLNHVYVGEFTNLKSFSNFILFKQIPIIGGAEVEVAIGQDHFFIVQQLNDQTVIEEYNYQHIQRIYKTKDLPLFNYRLQKPLTVDYSSQTGWLFMRATDGKETVVLVYEPGVVSHICLHKVLETKAMDFDNKTFDMAVDGGQQMFSYFNNNTIHRVVSILADAELYITPELETQQYVNELTTGVQVSNFPGNKPMNLVSKVTVLNTQSDINIKQSLLTSKKKVFKFVKQAQQQLIDMGTDWYYGQQVGIVVRCETCKSDLKVRNNIYRVLDGADMPFDISDGVQFGTAGQVYQTRDALIFQDITGKFKERKEISDRTISCELITVSADNNFILSSYTTTKNEVGIFINQCTNLANCQQFKQGSQSIGGAKKISKVVMPDNKNIIILNTDPENFSSTDSYIIISALDYDQSKFTISNKFTINDQYVGSKLLQIGDFDVIKYQINSVNYNTIVFTDVNNGLYFAHFAYDAQGVYSKTINEQVKLRSFANDQYHIADDAFFYQVKVLSSQMSGTTLQINLLITTSNSAHYSFGFDLDASKPTSGLPIIKANTVLNYVLTPYGSWNAIDKLAYVNGFVAIPYSNEKKVVIGVYDIPSDRPGIVKTISFNHGIWADYHKALPIDFAMLLTKDAQAKYPYLYTNINYDALSDEYLIEKYELRADPQLILTNSAGYTEQVQFKLYLHNDFVEIQGLAYLSTTEPNPPKPPDDDDKGSSNWWWITLIVIFGVAILGVGGWFAYQKFGRKGVDPLLG
ncbi:unnamed protein product [Paramecium pentaurelia]|uniref:Uncharacterized protein n=1 Tax=Paramecium pentaurelia TaxID=43138 RepID=A0A8S1T4W9_9CILI|nr:unnamed protein product [Paramecium pentaurelia]